MNTSFNGPVRSQNGFSAYTPGSTTANKSIPLATVGTGVVVPTIGPIVNITVPATITTAGAATYTAAQLKGGLLLRDPNGSGRSDITPTAALLVAALPSAVVGTSFTFLIRNDADAAETITVTAGTDCTTSGTMTIAQNAIKQFLVVLTNVTASTEAYTIYSLGTVVF